MRDECIGDMYPELTPAQRAIYARLSGQVEGVKDRLWAICWPVNPVLCEDVVDDALCGPTSDLLQDLREFIDRYDSEFLVDDDDGGPEHSGDAREEVGEGDDPAGAGASSGTGRGPATSEAAASDAPSPAPSTARERLQLVREKSLARAAREKSGPPVTP